MAKRTIAEGVVHKVPDDLKKALISNLAVLEIWNDLTPLARNEWICWTTIVKKEETTISSDCVQNFWKESAGPVVGPVAHTGSQAQENGLSKYYLKKAAL